MDCIVQYFVKPDNYVQPDFNNLTHVDELFHYSTFSVKKYAEKCGVDYQLITEARVNHTHPTFERLDLILNDDWWSKYNNVLYLDTDVVIWSDAPNCFEMYPDTDSFKPVHSVRAERKELKWHQLEKQNTILEKYDPQTLASRRFNAGVFMINESSAKTMRPFCDYKSWDDDDSRILIRTMLDSNVPTNYMNYRFNEKMSMTGYFCHAYGLGKSMRGGPVGCRKYERLRGRCINEFI
jgi:hypothetical protein|tara:strand:+ start:2944 stop:3654 length:711 start_codon:yes stop_codon:yes gene_type:complete